MAQSIASSSKSAATSPEVVREQLLRPYPSLSLRGLAIILVIIAVLSWGAAGSAPSALNRIDGPWDVVSSMGDLFLRMLPPEFELESGTSRTFTIFDAQIEVGWPLIIPAILETIQMSIIGTLGAVILSIPLSLLAAKNVSPHPIVYQGVRLFLNFLRSIPELVWAILFVAGVGLGAFTGAMALMFGSLGSLSRVYAEAIEQIDPAPVQALRATGAGAVQTFVYSVFPQALPLFISYSIIYFESNVRHATILGIVGAGGVGELLYKYTGLMNYNMVFGATLALVVAVTIIDRLSSYVRSRLI
ncbi:MAG: phosphonate ABC transporter, permease protein PhnE [bacterium]|nr:phosphonate ABC transporter, permease protein PhnE [bacterium]